MDDATTVVDHGGPSHALGADPRELAARAMIAALDCADIERMLQYMTDDVVTAFGNFPELAGKEAFRTLFRQVEGSVSSIHHDIHDLWHVADDPDVLVVRMTVSYTRRDGGTISLPCCNVFRMRANLVAHYGVYMDISPVLARQA